LTPFAVGLPFTPLAVGLFGLIGWLGPVGITGPPGVIGFGELGELIEGEVAVGVPGAVGVPMPVAPPVGLADAPLGAAVPPAPVACAFNKFVETIMAKRKPVNFFITQGRLKFD
jgi:hypothetical protein